MATNNRKRTLKDSINELKNSPPNSTISTQFAPKPKRQRPNPITAPKGMPPEKEQPPSNIPPHANIIKQEPVNDTHHHPPSPLSYMSLAPPIPMKKELPLPLITRIKKEEAATDDFKEREGEEKGLSHLSEAFSSPIYSHLSNPLDAPLGLRDPIIAKQMDIKRNQLNLIWKNQVVVNPRVYTEFMRFVHGIPLFPANGYAVNVETVLKRFLPTV